MSDTPESVLAIVDALDHVCENIDAHFFTMNYDIFASMFDALVRYADLLERSSALDDHGLNVAYQLGRTDGIRSRDAEIAALKSRVEELEKELEEALEDPVYNDAVPDFEKRIHHPDGPSRPAQTVKLPGSSDE